MPLQRAIRSVTLALAATGVLWGCQPAASGGAGEGDDGWAGAVLDEPLARPDFVLDDVDGEAYDFRAETEGKVALLFFGYSHCPDICPVHMANLAAVLRDLPSELSRHVEVVFVTVDPARDTPERLADWLGRIDRDIVGLRGTREEVNAVEEQLGLPPSYVVQRDDGTFDVGHAAQVLAFGADGPARLSYPWGTRQKDWQRDLPKLIRQTVDGVDDARR